MVEAWNMLIWIGTLGMIAVIMFILLKVMNIFFTWKESIENMSISKTILVVLKHMPIFIIAIPIANSLFQIFSEAQNIEDYFITTDIYYTLVVEQSLMMSLFIVGWTIIYICALLAYREYGGETE